MRMPKTLFETTITYAQYTCIHVYLYIYIHHNIYEISSRDNTHHFFLLHLYPLWSPPIGSTQPEVFRLQRLQWKLRYSKGSPQEMDGETCGNAHGKIIMYWLHLLLSNHQPLGLLYIFSRASRTKPSFATVTGLGVDPNHVYRCG